MKIKSTLFVAILGLLCGYQLTLASSKDFRVEVQQNNLNKIPQASMLFFGDMMLDRSVKKHIDSKGFDYLLKELAGENKIFFKCADIIHANLEGSFANKRISTSKTIAFRFDPILIPKIKEYGFNLFNLANNHTLDMGKQGFIDSKNNLKKNGVEFYGQQLKIDEDNLLIKKAGNFNFAFIGLDDTINKVGTDELKKLFDKAKENTVDFVIINIHWGDEYKENSNDRQKTLARTMIDMGADAIIGHHPHVVEEMEVYKGKPIFFSLGNFIFDQYFSTSTQQGLALGIIFSKNEDGKHVSVFPLPIESKQSQVVEMTGEKREKFLKNWIKKSRLEEHNFNNENIKL